MLCQAPRGIGSRLVIPQSWPFLRLIRCSGLQKLDPVFDSVFRKNKDDLIELGARDALLLRLLPKLALQRFAIGHVVIQVRPHHERGVTAGVENLP